MIYSKEQINNSIRKMLEEGRSNDDALDLFLKMKMENNLGPEQAFIKKGPSPAELKIHLLGSDDLSPDDVKLETLSMKTTRSNGQRLVVRLSPAITLYAEQSYDALQVTINGKNLTSMYLRSYRADDVARWMIRQKQKLNEYLDTWDVVLAWACKKVKIDHMAFLKIRALFTEGVKNYPRLKYTVIEQKRRAKIMVDMPFTNLGVCIYAWWGSYDKELPKQIESLKILLDAHLKSSLKNFYLHREK